MSDQIDNRITQAIAREVRSIVADGKSVATCDNVATLNKTVMAVIDASGVGDQFRKSFKQMLYNAFNDGWELHGSRNDGRDDPKYKWEPKDLEELLK